MIAVAFLGTGDAAAWREAARAASEVAPRGAYIARVQHTPPSGVITTAISRYAPDDETIKQDAYVVRVGKDTTMTDTQNAPVAHEFLWLDLETTGLDPHAGRVLEFAAVLCEDARGDDFAITASYASVIGASEADLAACAIDPYVRRMHNANGLWAACEADAASEAPTTIADVDAFLAAIASNLTGGAKRRVVLAGSSVHFDRAWCSVHLPLFAEYLSHRVFDVRTLRRAVDSWAPSPVAWPVRDAHRALDDVLATIAEARVTRRAMFGGAS